MFKFLSNIEIKKYSFFWWFIIVCLLACIGFIVDNLTHTYEFKKPEGIAHYEDMRDKITLNVTNQTTPNPCICENGSSGIMKEKETFSNAEKSLLGMIKIIAVVGFIFVILSAFGVSGGSMGGKRGMSLIAGIISLTIMAILLSNVLMPTIQSINTTVMICVC